MLMALVSDSALFNTREGRAGKVHNFMLGLNLNTSYPLSPLRDFTTQESFEDDDELDAAVAGRYPKRKQHELIQDGFVLFVFIYLYPTA
jgi:hypothetical protein